MCIESVESVEGHDTVSILANKGFLLGVDPHVDLQGVGGEKGLAAVVTFVLALILVDPIITSFHYSPQIISVGQSRSSPCSRLCESSDEFSGYLEFVYK